MKNRDTDSALHLLTFLALYLVVLFLAFICLLSSGNATMERLKQALTSSGQNYGALVLDLHCNLFGPTALFQVTFIKFLLR